MTLSKDLSVAEVRRWNAARSPGASHQGFPIVDDAGRLVGVLTRRDLLNEKLPDEKQLEEIIQHPPRFVYDDCTARQAADHMINHNIGRLPVVTRERPHLVVGIVTRSDILSGYRKRLEETATQSPTLRIPGISKRA